MSGTNPRDSESARPLAAKRLAILFAVLWTVAVGGSLAWTFGEQRRASTWLALSEAKTAYENESSVRHIGIWLLGLAGITLFHRHVARHARQLAADEAKFRESEQRFMDVLYASDDAILLLDGDVFIDCNEATAQMLGYASRDEFLLTRPSDLSPALQPDGRESTEKSEEMTRIAFEAGYHRFEWIHSRADGSDLTVEVTLTAITYHGRTILHGHWRDLTEHKRIQQETERTRQTLENILSSLPVGVAIIRRDRTLAHVNPAALAMMGYDSEQEITGQKCYQVFCPAGGSECPCADTGNPVENVEQVVVNRHGGHVPVLKTVLNVSIGGEDVLLETFVDISSRKQAEQALRKAKLEAEAADRAKSQFLASMSHELRTPLTGVLGFTDLLLAGDQDPDERREYLETIRFSGRHLLKIINDILDLSKIEADQVELNLAQFDPRDLLAEVVSIMRPQAEAKGIALQSSWQAPLPENVEADESKLRQILLNLVGNAIKFTDSGRVTISASATSDDQAVVLCLDVTDTGEGIAAEKLGSVFDPFVQADASVTRKYGGTGLGLAISRRLATALGGTITADSTLGVGSTFSVRVPVSPAKGIDAVVAKGNVAGSDSGIGTAELPAEQRLMGRVLLVDDGQVNQLLVAAVLEHVGMSVDTADNGELAIAAVKSQSYDVILMDMQMPVLDGYAATRQLREMGCSTPIIALTAHAMKGDKENCLAAGCTHYISKPIDIPILLHTIAESLDRSRGSHAAPSKSSCLMPSQPGSGCVAERSPDAGRPLST